MALKLSNNAKSNLSVALSSTATTMSLVSVANFPDLSVGDWHPATLIDSSGNYEIVRVTSKSTGSNTLGIERAREGTTALAFPVGASVELRMTKEAFDQFTLSGQSSFTVLNGLNFGVSIGAAGSGIYTTSISDISTYGANLKISVLPHSANPAGTFVVNLNGLGNVNVRLPDGTVPPAGAATTSRTMELRYKASTNTFILENAIPAGQSLASDTVAGLAQRGTEEDFDTNGDNVKFTTQRNVSRMIEDSRDDSLDFPHAWRYFGSARDGGTYNPALPANSGTLNANDPFEIENLLVPAGQTLNFSGFGVAIVRATTSIIIEGTVVLPRTNRVSDLLHVGPNGGPGPGTAQPISQLASQRPSGSAIPMTDRELLSYVKSGVALNHFHGGQGGQGDNGSAPYAAGGLILIAPLVEIRAGATFLDMYSTPVEPNDPANGGGMIVLSGNSVAVDAAALYEAGAQGSINTGTHWNAESNAGNFDNPPAHNGSVFVVRLLQDEVIRVF